MTDKTEIELHPDKVMLESSNGHIFMNISFNNKRQNLLIELNHSQINYISTELNLLKQKALIASEYLK